MKSRQGVWQNEIEIDLRQYSDPLILEESFENRTFLVTLTSNEKTVESSTSRFFSVPSEKQGTSGILFFFKETIFISII